MSDEELREFGKAARYMCFGGFTKTNRTTCIGCLAFGHGQSGIIYARGRIKDRMQLLAWNITKNGMVTLGTLLLRLDEMTAGLNTY
jgi:hypothetical protein